MIYLFLIYFFFSSIRLRARLGRGLLLVRHTQQLGRAGHRERQDADAQVALQRAQKVLERVHIVAGRVQLGHLLERDIGGVGEA